MTEGQLLFEFASEFPELVETRLKETLQEYVAEMVASGRIDVDKLITETVKEEARELAQTVFFSGLTDREEPLSTVLRREGTARLLDLRRSVLTAMAGLEEDLDQLRIDFSNHLQSRNDKPDGEEPGSDLFSLE